MALRTAPAFIGKVTVTTGTNDKIYWFETGPYNLSATLTAGEYTPLALAQHIASTMTTESGASGATNSYSASFDVATAIITLTRSGGSATWYPKVTTSESQNVLTGSVVDTAGDALSVGQYGGHHLGWLIASSSPAAGTSHSADQACAHCWIPSLPPETDSEEVYEPTICEAIAVDGSGDVYRFSDWIIDKDEFPLYGGDWQRRSLTFGRMTQADTTWFLAQFWGPYAGGGGTFLFYPDKTDTGTSYNCRISGDGLRKASRGARQTGYPLWTIDLPLRRAPAS